MADRVMLTMTTCTSRPECEVAAQHLEQDLSRFEQVLSTAVAYSLTEAEV